MHANLHELNKHFGIEDVLYFSAGEGGLWRAIVTTDRCVGEIYRHGAHLTRWRPTGFDEVLWMSAKSNFLYDQPIRGGVPICFPWFGGNRPAGHEEGPAHGYARIITWEFTDVQHDDRGLTLTLRTAIEPFVLDFTVVFADTLTMRLKIANTGNEVATCEAALHTYFTASQIKQVQVLGLENTPYIDTVGGGQRPMQQGDEPVTFTAETDRRYISKATTQIVDPGLSRIITIDKEGSDTTVVWNPWVDKSKAMNDFGDEEWPGMLCVETASVHPHDITLKPGQSHTMQAVISVQGL